jgi:transposase-like protein
MSGAAGLSHSRFCHWRWYLAEMYVKLNGEVVYPWRVVDQEAGGWANRVENRHLSFRRRERAMLGFKRMKSLREFASAMLPAQPFQFRTPPH